MKRTRHRVVFPVNEQMELVHGSLLVRITRFLQHNNDPDSSSYRVDHRAIRIDNSDIGQEEW